MNFVVAVPMFVLIIEAIGMWTRDERYDQMAYEFIKVTITAYSLTALLGGLLTFSLLLFYPHLFNYMAVICKGSMFAYALLFFAESAVLYMYYYGWHWLQGGDRKWVHLTLGLLLNAVGLQLMFLANAWTTFMMSPAAVDAAGVFNGDTWAAIHNFLWNPINIHRAVANVAYGGSIVGAYAAFKLLSAASEKERAHYDWMGYNANFIAIAALLPLPFAGVSRPGRPTDNAKAESFIGRFREECLNAHRLLSLEDARSKIEAWRQYITSLVPTLHWIG